MNLSNIKGYLGELYVIRKLQSEGGSIIQKGNQSGYDVGYNNYKIDVKMSSHKDDLNAGFKFWGWALKQKNKKKPISCTHFVCIALDDNSNSKYYFIINSKHINSFPKGIGQFKSVNNGFSYYEDYVNFKNDKHKCYFETCRNLLLEGKVIKVGSNESLKNALDKSSMD